MALAEPMRSPGRLPLEEHGGGAAIIEPHALAGSRLDSVEGMPEEAVLCFFPEVIEDLASPDGDLRGVEIHRLAIPEHGVHPVWLVECEGRQVAVVQAGLGAPLSAILLETVIALGARKVVVCGGAGAVDRDLALGHVVVVDSAVRDEGTSYHYLKPAREIATDPGALRLVTGELEKLGVEHRVGKTWSTDAFFRETPEVLELRRGEGCIVVDMEASALLAVARFRGVKLVPILYAADDVSGDEWDHRDWNHALTARRHLFDVAVHAAAALH